MRRPTVNEWTETRVIRAETMTSRRIMIVMAVIVTFIAGMVGGAVVAGSRPRPPELWEIWPEQRQGEVDSMFADYKAGRIIYTALLPVLGSWVKVRVVNDRFRGADYGFVPLSEIGDVPIHFWYLRTEFELKKYDKEHLFVRLDDRYVNDMKRNPTASQYSPASDEEKK
jgi:hypothetical protein